MTTYSLPFGRSADRTLYLGLLVLGWLALVGCGAPGTGESTLPKRMVRGGWLAKNDVGEILSQPTRSAVEKMTGLGIQWVALGPEVMMPDIFRPEMSYGKEVDSYRTFVRWAKQQNMRILLLPRIESPSFFKPPFPFRADIQMLTTDHTDKFFANYEAMLLFWAKFCEEEKVEMFGLGLEYLTLVKEHPDRWRKMIASVRKVYKGKLTYSANWYEEYKAVTFWDTLDTIGIGAYFELNVEPNATPEEIRTQWTPILNDLKSLSQQYNKPILFTEVGYTAFHDAARYPWKWQDDLSRPLSLDHQADCYQVLFETFSEQPWFEGMFLWRFYTSPEKRPRYDYNPIGKPAENVIQQWFRLPSMMEVAPQTSAP
ncbi:MAG: hypothetical protein EP343_27875 [Deltaproteobacteria bacterium]|nr:MAG: hypothetical protein EP343_27875 [Deltaproteobacteria bacterium]